MPGPTGLMKVSYMSWRLMVARRASLGRMTSRPEDWMSDPDDWRLQVPRVRVAQRTTSLSLRAVL